MDYRYKKGMTYEEVLEMAKLRGEENEIEIIKDDECRMYEIHTYDLSIGFDGGFEKGVTDICHYYA